MLVILQSTATRRFLNFGSVGLGVMLAGAGLMVILVDVFKLNENLAYAIQAFFSIETNFFFNYCFTWRDRRPGLLKGWVKFHTTKIFTILLNQLLFTVLITLGIHHLIAYFGCVAVVTILNFVANDKFVFTHSEKTEE